MLSVITGIVGESVAGLEDVFWIDLRHVLDCVDNLAMYEKLYDTPLLRGIAAELEGSTP